MFFFFLSLSIQIGYSGAWKDEFKENFGYNVTWAESFAVVQSIARQDGFLFFNYYFFSVEMPFILRLKI